MMYHRPTIPSQVFKNQSEDNEVKDVEQGAFMSPNPSGMDEDPCCWLCVCLDVFEFLNPLSVTIQGFFDSNPFEKYVFSKESENSTY